MRVFLKLKTFYALGLVSLLRALYYRLSVRFGLNPVKKISANLVYGEFFYPYKGENIVYERNTQWLNQHVYFGWFKVSNTDVPDWYKNVFTGISKPNLAAQPWWDLQDFMPELGDIKTIWEPSRFDWVLCFAQAAASGDAQALSKLNNWLNDWIKNNPFYFGLNWKCGQEASIRVMHLVAAALILNQHKSPSRPLLHLIKSHLKRISPTIQYAIAQNNNHGTSEAAALYVGGSFLVINADNDGQEFYKLGLKWLEDRAINLIEEDGTFSQYSVNYHRLMLDTYSFTEVWRKKNNFPLFSDSVYKRLRAATNWLYQITDMESGDTPNLGANDGARLFQLTNADYRDTRPSVQLAMVLFQQCCAWKNDGLWNLPLKWFEIDIPSIVFSQQKSCSFKQGGYSILKNNSVFVLFSHTKFKYRPSQCDVLHLDVWVNGSNILRDAGTYSYNTSVELMNYFGGTEAHNTIQFDHNEQMPRVSRFLLGDWIKTFQSDLLEKETGIQVIKAGYVGGKGESHFREVALKENFLSVKDVIAGFKKTAVLRWRLVPGQWTLNGNVLSKDNFRLVVTADENSELHFSLNEGVESRYYLQKSSLPVFEIAITNPGNVYTECYFSS